MICRAFAQAKGEALPITCFRPFPGKGLMRCSGYGSMLYPNRQ